jgi:hypothetical protein
MINLFFLKINKCLKEIRRNLIVLNNTLKVANKFLIKFIFHKIRVLHLLVTDVWDRIPWGS